MNIHVKVATRVLTAEFYISNAMFFLLAIAFCFGFLRGVEHIALAGYFVSSVWLALVPIGIWMAYTFKVVMYNNRELRADQNRFLNSLPLLSSSQRTYTYMAVSVGQLLPALAYGLFLVLFAVKQGQWNISLLIVVTLAFLTSWTAWSIHRSLVHPEKEASTARAIRQLDRMMAKPLAWMFIEGIVRQRPGLVYSTKIATCLVAYGVSQLYLYEDYDARLYSMMACAVFSANLAIVYQYQRFEIVHLLLRSLPLSFARRILSLTITTAVLCFPEITMLATNLPDNLAIQHYFFAIVFGLSLMIMGYGALYVRDATFDSFTRWIFFVSMGWIVMILFGVPLLAGAVVHVLLGIFLLKRHFYSFEVA